jgi:hypothetical protein
MRMNWGFRSSILVACVAALLLFEACNPNTIRKIPLHDLTVKFVEFGNGSEWNYVLEGDTVVKENVKAEGYVQGKNVYDEVENSFIVYDLKSNLNQHIQVRAESGLKDPIDRVVFVTNDNTEFVYGPVFWCNGAEFIGNAVDTLTMHSSFMVGDLSYPNVLHLKLKNNPVYRSIAISREIGIVRKEYSDGKVFLLTSYRVTK